MTKIYTVELTDAEDKALAFATVSQQDWIDNFVHHRCRIAMEDIVKICVEQCLSQGMSIPNTREDMIDLAFQQGWIKTAYQSNEEAKQMPAPTAGSEPDIS